MTSQCRRMDPQLRGWLLCRTRRVVELRSGRPSNGPCSRPGPRGRQGPGRSGRDLCQDVLWTTVGPIRRFESGTALLRRAADRIEERFEEFVAAEMADTGKPITQARELDVARALTNFRTFADIVAAAGQESFVTDLAGGKQALNYAIRKPLGVVAVIVPWNLPLLLLTWKVAPALACGNSVVVKPSEETPGDCVVAGRGCSKRSACLPASTTSSMDSVRTRPASSSPRTPVSTASPSPDLRQRGSHVMKNRCPAGPSGLVRARRQERRDRVRRRRHRRGSDGSDQVGVHQHRPGLPVHRAGVRAPQHFRRHRRVDSSSGQQDCVWATRRSMQRRPDRLISQAHRKKVLDYFEIAEREGAKVLTGGGIPDLGQGTVGRILDRTPPCGQA